MSLSKFLQPIINYLKNQLGYLPLVALAVALSGCSVKTPGQFKTAEHLHGGTQGGGASRGIDENLRRVGMLLPLSGPFAELGKSLKRSAEMSLFDHGQETLEISFYDTKGTPDGAQAAYRDALKEGVSLVLGPVFSKSVLAVKDQAHQAGVRLITFSNDPTIAGGNILTFGFSASEQVESVFNHIVQNHKVVAVVLPRSSYGNLVEGHLNRLRMRAPDVHFEIIYYSNTGSDLIKELSPLQTLKINAIFIPEGGTTLSRIVSALLYQDISLENIQIYGTGQWEDELTLKNNTLQGALIPAPDPRLRTAFETKYNSTYGEKPIRLASLAYDLVSMVSALDRHFQGSPFALNNLKRQAGFEGIDGVFRFNENGQSERKLALMRLSPEGLRLIRAAERRFQ